MAEGDIMFYGDYDHTMDNKGRVSFPAKFREKMSGTFYITKGLDDCLFVFPEEQWRQIEAKLTALPLTSQNARNFVRQFFSGAMETTLDKQGRVMINLKLRQHASLEKEVSIIGVGNRIEIWNSQKWLDFSQDEEMSFENNAHALAELGI